MAEQIPYGVAVSLINRLASFAFREIGRIYGVMDELEKLKETLESIKIVLSDAEQRQGQHDQDSNIEHWIRRFKKVLHDADDLLDGLVIKDLRRKVDGGSKSRSKVRDFFSSENQLTFHAKLARKIEKIQKNFNGVAEDMSKLKLNPSLVILKQNKPSWRETSSVVLQSEIIGREENKNDIVDLLKQTHTNESISLIAIVGMGGLGKTALAQLVYNAAQEQDLFQKYMWVCISKDFEVKTVLTKMLKSLQKSKVGDLELDILQQKLQEKLNGQRYMLVLDDVWNENLLKWNDLRKYLVCGGQGSKILVTTRSTLVSQIMGIKTPYVLKGLTKKQSWTLLKNLKFGEDNSRVSPSLESIGEKIAEKCGGVPLAIKTMGGFLRTINEEANQWSNILNDDIWRLCKEEQTIMPVLKLSYQNLPLVLRQCFAYCSLYPKDWEIQKNELVQLWMAQGYLESSIEMQSMEDVGNQYVKILLMGSFFQDASRSVYGDIVSFKMHGLMHDLAKSIAGNDCYLDNKDKEIVGRPMHISFTSGTICSLNMLDASKLRSILRSKVGEVGSVANLSFIKNLKYLRALDVSNSKITQLPESIGKIKHLRYLDLSFCDELICLPKSIDNLVCLQTLKLNWCEKLVFPAKIITKLINLRYLDIDNCKTFRDMMPAGMGKLVSLQYLSNFAVGDSENSKSSKLNELKELNKIGGELTISNLGLVEDVTSESQEANLRAKEHIRSLNLYWRRHGLSCPSEIKNSDSLQLLDNLCPHQNLRTLLVEDFPGVRFSSWLLTLTDIVEIVLTNFPNCQHLPPLERLLCLKKLRIELMSELKWMHYEKIANVFFPSLEELLFECCPNLTGWQMLRDDKKANEIENHLLLPPFPRLSSLQIGECPNLTCMPTFPHLVEELRLENCSLKPMIETCSVQLESSSFYPLSGLKHLRIHKVTEIEALAEDWMQNLTSLESLSLAGLSTVQPLLRHLQHLPSELQYLRINYIDDDKLDLWKVKDEDNTERHGPPDALHSLRKISFHFCKNMKAFPEQIGNLQSLRHIEIFDCPELESLHEAERCLPNLQTLRIVNCPLLRDRCQAEIGQDWHKIAHIPHIYVGRY